MSIFSPSFTDFMSFCAFSFGFQNFTKHCLLLQNSAFDVQSPLLIQGFLVLIDLYSMSMIVVFVEMKSFDLSLVLMTMSFWSQIFVSGELSTYWIPLCILNH
jgi:hypothetical protein